MKRGQILIRHANKYDAQIHRRDKIEHTHLVHQEEILENIKAQSSDENTC